ncbi:hypothetical protein FOCC_FOCC004088 [Frankliniella occidentalis]|uniref:Uncharacterized protein LOC113211661 n=1 Tax=Frankliniella occidentalis TaxID=133901 RepID=A0A6J1T5I8_FRAOC|nr:uncharacterized protein LOC113211661 [Frankliniella occidentalis]KAE8749181.1 hypothetical protein FOCC_FOCC004088 [Frankliniella occidentalis]
MKLVCVLLAVGCVASAQAAAVSSRETFELVSKGSSFGQCVVEFGKGLVDSVNTTFGFVEFCLAIPLIGIFMAPLIGIFSIVFVPIGYFLDMLTCLGITHEV